MLFGETVSVTAAIASTGAHALLLIVSLVLSAHDIRTRTLPHALLAVSSVVVFAWLLVMLLTTGDVGRFTAAVLSAAGMFVVTLVLALINPQQLGGGDVKLAPLCGLVLGWHGWLTTFVALFTLVIELAIALTVTIVVSALRYHRSGVSAPVSHIPLAPIALLALWLAIIATSQCCGERVA